MPLGRVLAPVCSSALIRYILASVAEGSSVGPQHVQGRSVASLAVKGSRVVTCLALDSCQHIHMHIGPTDAGPRSALNTPKMNANTYQASHVCKQMLAYIQPSDTCRHMKIHAQPLIQASTRRYTTTCQHKPKHADHVQTRSALDTCQHMVIHAQLLIRAYTCRKMSSLPCMKVHTKRRYMQIHSMKIHTKHLIHADTFRYT
jgi:hypothetical protein